MSPEEMKLDMLVAELDYENRLLRARNERLEREAEQRKPWIGLTDEEIKHMLELFVIPPHHVEMVVQTIEAKLREKNQ
jgi:hypothetical protein